MRLRWKIAIAVIAVAAILGVVFRKEIVARILTAKEQKNLAGLLPQVRTALQILRARLSSMGIETTIGQTKRSDEEQDAIFNSGASSTTNSWHELGRAVDMYVHGPDSKVDMNGVHVDRYLTMHREAAKLGFRGLAFDLATGAKKYITVNKGKPTEKKKWDGGHLEFPEGMTFTQAAKQRGQS